MSETYQSLSHSKWDCKYYVVFVPKRRRKAIFGQTRRQLGAIFHALARQKECQIIEGGCGDFIMVGGNGDKPSLTCETRLGPDGQLNFEKG